MYDKIVELTKKMVEIPSVNATLGEKNIGNFIYEYLSKIPYFQKHPTQVFMSPLKNDDLGRVNVYGLLIGEKSDCNDTIILHGHIDTVDVDDFGSLKEYAFQPDRLREEMLKIKEQFTDEVQEDLESGKYMFGRGASDMKSGDAVHIAVLEHLCEHPEELKGNILVSFNPVEESLHTGFIDGIDVLLELKEKYGLNYIFAINNDYICGMYQGDETRYIYTGSVGKLLPCFYVKGKETHVGQAYEGVDACRINSEIVRLINLNTDLCDGYKGEYPAPPTALKSKDLKPYYNVQTPLAAFSYFNYMVHNKSVNEVLADLKNIARKAADNVLAEMNDSYGRYCELTGIEYKPIQASVDVMEYREVYNIAKEKCKDIDNIIDELTNKSIKNGDDKREISLAIIEKLVELTGIIKPVIVVFFATPHCPHNTLKDEVSEEKELTDEIQGILDEFAEEYGEKFKIMHFFPSLTDSSYLKIDDDMESIASLEANFPKQDALYPVPYKKIYNLNIPGLNFGCFGKDAHKRTERVQLDYSFNKLPKLIIETINHYLK